MTPRPDASDPASFNRRFVKLAGDDGHTYETIDQPPLDWVGPISEAPTLLLCHGFPDQAIGFRYQIHEFASRGYRVLVPCQLGYGGTSKPLDVRKYSFKAVAYDMNLLLDACGVKGPVIVVGHDWGGMVAWRFANYFPHRVQALVAVCTPYQAPATAGMPSIPDEVLFRKYLPQFGYQLYFQSDAAILELDEVIDQFLQPMHSASYRRGKDKPKEGEMSHWVLEGRLQGSIRSQIKARRAGNLPLPPPDKELDAYIDAYKQGGMRGPLSWYKTRATNFAEEQAAKLPPFPAHIPCLQLPAELDAALPPAMCLAPAVLKCFPGGNLEVRVLDGADHWCLQDEKVRDKVTATLIQWIDHVVAGKWKPGKGAPAVSHL